MQIPFLLVLFSLDIKRGLSLKISLKIVIVALNKHLGTRNVFKIHPDGSVNAFKTHFLLIHPKRT